MKTLFLAACLAIAVAVPASAQRYGVTTVIAGGTNNVAAFATNTYSGSGLAIHGYEQIALFVSYKQASASSSNITVRIAKSLDGTTFETIPSIAVFVNGTNYVTNLNLGAVGHWRVATAENTNAALALTNFTVSYAIKPALTR